MDIMTTLEEAVGFNACMGLAYMGNESRWEDLHPNVIETCATNRLKRLKKTPPPFSRPRKMHFKKWYQLKQNLIFKKNLKST